MLQSSFTTIKQHFKPDSQINKNVFLTKEYDYPAPLQQRLYLAYLEVQQMLRTRTHDQIVKRINTVNTRNDRNMQKIVMGFVYALILHDRKDKPVPSTTNQTSHLFQTSFNQQNSGERITAQISQYFGVFRSQTWTLFNNVTVQIISNHFYQIRPFHRFGFIAIFRYLQKYSVCTDDMFIALMKTLNYYDQTGLSLRFNLQLIGELHLIIDGAKKAVDQWSVPLQLEEMQVFSQAKVNEQMSLMRHYLFGKMLHWQALSEKIRGYKKNQWPLNLQRLTSESLRVVVALFLSKPEECLVFSSQLCRHAQFCSPQAQLNSILERIIKQSTRPLNPQYMAHHYNLAPITIQFLLPSQIEKTINQLSKTLYVEQKGQEKLHLRVQKLNVHLVLDWMWRDCHRNFSQHSHKNYLLENCFSDVVRWCLLAHDKNLELRSFVIEWVMYQSSQNQFVHKSVREAYFYDWLYYLKIAQNTDFNAVFSILAPSLHIVNYFAFFAPNLAQNLLVYILGKNVLFKTPYHSGNLSEGLFRMYINQILKKAESEGILRTRQIILQSQLSNFVKNQLQIRIRETQTQGIQHHRADLILSSHDKNLAPSNSRQSQTPGNLFINQNQYYGDRSLNINFDLKQKPQGLDSLNEDEDDIMYLSHQLIPSSPSYHYNQEVNSLMHQGGQQQLNFSLQRRSSLKRQSGQQLKRESGFQQNRQSGQQQLSLSSQPNPKRQNPVSIHQLQKQASLINNQNQREQAALISNREQPVNKAIKNRPNPEKTPPKHTDTHLQDKTLPVKLQKQFTQQMGEQIRALAQNPTISQFTQFMKSLTKILKQYKRSTQQQEMVERFLQQTAKVLYLVFNREFQAFQFTEPTKEQSWTKQKRYLTYFLLSSINQHWKQSLTLYNVLVYKKLVKYLCESFQSCQFTFYYIFLDIFKRGVPHYREMKFWLFQKQSQKHVIPALQKILGTKFKLHIYENAQVLKIQ